MFARQEVTEDTFDLGIDLTTESVLLPWDLELVVRFQPSPHGPSQLSLTH